MWRNGRRARLRGVFERVWVQVPPLAPNKKNPNHYGEDFFVCTFIFSFFVFLFSSHRIIFDIKNKKEERKVAVEFFKRQTKMPKAFCAYSLAKKKVPRKALSCFRRLSRPNATRNLWPPKMLAFLEKRSKQVIVSCVSKQKTRAQFATPSRLNKV